MPGSTFLPQLDVKAEPVPGASALLQDWLDSKVSQMRAIFAAPATATTRADPAALLALMQHHEFNYQSKGKTAHLGESLTERFQALINMDQPLPVYFLFHGGYRTRVGADFAHTFAPDLTELMLIWQVARLKARLEALHAPGLRFGIVINNGVAAFTNGISYESTNAYVQRLRLIIERLGAGRTVWVLNQFELGDFAEQMARIEVLPKPAISPAEHGIVERFLGRPCSADEAALKSATYEQAEAVWGRQVRGIVAEAGGIFCRQIAHPACLSFRPFPGGAIRVQNGAVTFRIKDGQIKPGFVTPVTWARELPRLLPVWLDLFAGIQPEPCSKSATERRRA